MLTRAERFRRHLRVNSGRAVLGGISVSGITAGFMDATDQHWDLLWYIVLAAVVAAAILAGLGAAGRRLRLLLLVPGTARARTAPGRPRQLELVPTSRGAPVRQVAAARCDDPVYGAGLRALLEPSRPLLVIPSNRRDVGREHELLLPLFADRERRSRVEVDLSRLRIPVPPYAFDRELPEGVQDVDHTLAVKDLVFLPELAAALTGGDETADAPIMWPEPASTRRCWPSTMSWWSAARTPTSGTVASSSRWRGTSPGRAARCRWRWTCASPAPCRATAPAR